MTVFGAYSQYYNLLYRDKDYAGETEYIHNLITHYSPEAKTVLDLGCGTGRHDLLLADKGYEITGVDLSEEMLAIANAQRSALASSGSTCSFQQGDIRNIRLGRTFDVVISLFHVMSYQTTNDDILAAFATAGAHLRAGGIFIFDCWYGPAVLTDRPAVRVKRLENADISVTRVAEPVLWPNANLVDVNYQVLVRDKCSGALEEILESHRMRYLFQPEIEMLLKDAGLNLVAAEEWLTGRPVGFDTWSANYVVRK